MPQLREGIYDLIVFMGSPSDRKRVDPSGALEALTAMGVRWARSAVSAHRHKTILCDCCEEMVDRKIPFAWGIASMSAALPGDIAGWCGGKVIVFGTPLSSPNDPDAGKAAFVMLDLPPGATVSVNGFNETGLKNTALAIAQVVALIRPEIIPMIETYVVQNVRKPVPELDDYQDYVPWKPEDDIKKAK